MSCNGCRVLRKGCSESCILRPCLEWIEGAEAQGHATIFVAKFFGRAGLMSFISSVPESQRPAVFQSLLFEACGRTVNPVNGAVGLMCTGRWHVCQSAVETVLRGGVLIPLSDPAPVVSSVDAESSCTSNVMGRRSTKTHVGCLKRKPPECDDQGSAAARKQPMLLPATNKEALLLLEKRRPSSPSEESVTTSWDSEHRITTEKKLLNLFV